MFVLQGFQGSGIQCRYTVTELESFLEYGGLQKYKAESFVPIFVNGNDSHRSRGIERINIKGCIWEGKPVFLLIAFNIEIAKENTLKNLDMQSTECPGSL